MTPLNLQTIGIAEPIVTAILFGLYLASFAHCIRWLLFEDEGWRIRKKINRVLVTTTLLIFLLSAGSFSATAAVGTWGSISFSGKAHAPAYFWVVTIFSSNATYFSILMIIDSVLIHRCWVVFSKNWFIICIPLALWCSCLVCAIISFYCAISPVLYIATDLETIQICTVEPAQTLTFYVCNIVVSIYTTAALVFKIRRCMAENNVASTNHLYRTSRILTESGILYTLSSGFFLANLIISYIVVPTTTNSYALVVLLLYIAVPFGTFMPGIAFNLITIRVGEQRASGEDTWVDSRGASKVLMSSGLLNHPDTLIQQEVESTDLGQEGIDEEVTEINGTEIGKIMEADRTPEQER